MTRPIKKGGHMIECAAASKIPSVFEAMAQEGKYTVV